MTWNYRVTRELVPVMPGSDEQVHQYGIRELYYDGAGKVNGWTDEHVIPVGDTWHELIEDLARVHHAAVTFDVFDIDTREWITPNRRGE